jgi:hypothetical protein
MQQASTNDVAERVPQERYSYYRRCQIFRKNGEQCKAPAEKGSQICYAHAGQLALALRRERERRAVLAEAVAEMRRRGKQEYEAKDLFMDFKGIQVTLAKMAQALIDGRIDCKTAGRLALGLQMASKLLWIIHRKGRKENQILPQICADERRLNSRAEARRKPLPLISTDDTDRKKSNVGKKLAVMSSAGSADQSAGARIFKLEVTAFGDASRAHGPPEAKAA